MKRFVSYVLILLMLLLCAFSASADQLSDAQNKKNSAAQKAEDIKDKKEEAEEEKDSLEDKAEELEEEQDEAEDKYDKLKKNLKELDNELKAVDESLKQSEEEYNKQKLLFKDRVREMYKNTRSMSYLKVLAESKSVTDFFRRIKLVSTITKNNQQIIDDLETAKKDVEDKKKMKVKQFTKIEAQAEKLKETSKSIKISRSKVENTIDELKDKISEYEEQIDQFNQEAEKWGSEIRALMKTGKQYTGGTMVWPSPTTRLITSDYGWRRHPILGKSKLHTGIDIGAHYGEPIIAANKGTVVFAGYQTGYGKTVIIDHGGGICTLYGHASKILVDVGDEVKASQTIAKVGSTGWSTGPHLHFEVRKNGDVVDPHKYVG